MLKSRPPLQGGPPFPCRLGLVYFAKGVWPVSAHPWGRASGGGGMLPQEEMPDALTAAGLVSPGLGLSSVAFCAVVQAGLGGVNYAVRARCARGAGRWGRGKTPGNGGVFFFGAAFVVATRCARGAYTPPSGAFFAPHWVCCFCAVRTPPLAPRPRGS